ncbi:MAG: SCO family protein [Chitinophagales bacterium]|nr:SCO family protein [Bacteroidota bacterium]MCB9256686.1 SCO family protein [Chitinophagales bacterium]
MLNKKNKYYFAVALAILLATSAYFFLEVLEKDELPVLSEVIGKENGENIYYGIDDFSGFDQNGNSFSQAKLKGKVHLANFFFCSCPVVCPKMTVETKKVVDAIGEREDFLMVSYSIDPKRDSSEQLMNFANRFEANKSNWYFLNVGKENVYKLARYSYKIVAVQGSEGNNDFIHSEVLTLVDDQLRIRGYYDSTKPEEIEKLIKDLKKLL